MLTLLQPPPAQAKPVSYCSLQEPAFWLPLQSPDSGAVLSQQWQASHCFLWFCCRSKPVSRPSDLGRVRRAWSERALHPAWPPLQPRGTSVTVATQTTDEGPLVLPEEHGVAVGEPEVTSGHALCNFTAVHCAVPRSSLRSMDRWQQGLR